MIFRKVWAINADFGESGVPGRRYLRKRTPVAMNVHVVLLDSDLWRRNIWLRDYLRTHPIEAQRYGEQKKAIVESGGNMLLVYSERKTAFISKLIRRAELWARKDSY